MAMLDHTDRCEGHLLTSISSSKSVKHLKEESGKFVGFISHYQGASLAAMLKNQSGLNKPNMITLL